MKTQKQENYGKTFTEKQLKSIANIIDLYSYKLDKLNIDHANFTIFFDLDIKGKAEAIILDRSNNNLGEFIMNKNGTYNFSTREFMNNLK